MEDVLYDKILGCLLGGASGDAMGAATEGRSRGEISKLFGHKVETYEIPPNDTFGAGNKAGGFTDDFSSAYFAAESVVNNNGVVDEEVVKRALIEWSEHHEFFDRFAGPTTRLAIRRYKGEEIPVSNSIKNRSRAATNGSAMRIAPVGLFNAGDVEAAIKDAVVLAGVTHNNTLALSGAGAVAAAVAEACKPGADMIDVACAGIYGAQKGEKIGQERGVVVSGPSVSRRIEIAVDLANTNDTLSTKVDNITEVIGTGLHISEAVPSAFGFFVACRGNAFQTIIETINAGYDTDTVGTIAGAIAGAYDGAATFPDNAIEIMEGANGLKIEKLARDIFDIACPRMQRLGFGTKEVANA